MYCHSVAEVFLTPYVVSIMSTKKRFAGITPGGPCPAVNAAMASAAIAAQNSGNEFYLIRNAFEHIAKSRTDCFERLTPRKALLILPRGGTFAGTSKTYPPGNEEQLRKSARVLVENFDGLFATGGDGSITIFVALKPYIEAECKRLGKSFPIILAMKSIDDDGALPEGVRMLGASTMAEVFGHRIASLKTDTQSSGDRWQLAVAMGRTRGHVAMAGSIHGFPHVFIIGEQFTQPTPLKFIIDILGGAMLKRAAEGKPYGVAVIAEGLVQALDPRSHRLLLDLPRDSNGALNPSLFPFEAMISGALAEFCDELQFKAKMQVASNNYDLRGSQPNGFDRRLAIELGVEAIVRLMRGETERVLYKLGSRFHDEPFANFVPDPNAESTERVKDRPVDLSSDDYRIARFIGQQLETADLDDTALLEKMAALTRFSPADLKHRLADVARWGDGPN